MLAFDEPVVLSNGNGTFNTVTLPANIDLQQNMATFTQVAINCQPLYSIPNPVSSSSQPVALGDFGAKTRTDGGRVVSQQTSCWNYSSIGGKRYYVLDVDGDGILDIVPSYSWNSSRQVPLPSAADMC